MSQPIKTKIEQVAFLGLGVMGAPMAGHLAQAGHAVCVYNRTQSKAEAWLAEHPQQRWAATPAEAAAGASWLVMCVGRDQDVEQLLLGEQGALHQLQAGAVILDHTTTSAHLAHKMAAACAQKGVIYLDAPVSGGQQGAERGCLTVMVGGEEAAYRAAEPIMAAYAANMRYMGASGAGQLTKMVNQICIAGLVQSLAEGLHFAQQAGLDQQQVIDVIRHGAAGSWQMEQRHQTMIADQYEHGFAVDWMRKDLGLCLEQARHIGARLPVAALVDQFYADVQALGGGRWDTSSLLRRLIS
ncbi:NAD(P)-dependent oxidoreductase [Marinospirillum sp. MEB164]|uniref:NAD(P)-dependent oxidoreductase n=1 Tax=Marinospirillum alkalitolerans TaxID=3123374 RepID=A0ABW8PZX6_9GAMM